MNKQWMIRLSAVAMILPLTACEIGGGSGGGDTTPSDTGGDIYSDAGTGTVPDSGQTSCYYDIYNDGFYNPTANTCAGELSGWQPYGQDAHYTINAMSYTDNGDGTVLDNITGLTWQQCALGESGPGCTLGAIGSYSWSEANSACAASTLAGGGWRLPSVTELMRIVDYEESFGTINHTAFPGGTVSLYWTSTPHAIYSSWAWYVEFSQGAVMVDDKIDYHYVRCVRG